MVMEFPVHSGSNEWQAFGDDPIPMMKTSDPFQPFGDDEWTPKLEFGDASPTISSTDIEKYGYETTPENDGRGFTFTSPSSQSKNSSSSSSSSFGQNRGRRHSIDHFSRQNEDEVAGFDPFFTSSSPNGVDVEWKKTADCGIDNNAISSADIDKYGYGKTHENDGRFGSSSSSSRSRSRQQLGRRRSMELSSNQRESNAFDRSSCQATQTMHDDGSDEFGAVSVNSKVKHFRKAVRRNSNGVLRKRIQERRNSSNNLEDDQNYGQQDAADTNRTTSRSKSPSGHRAKLNRASSDDNLKKVPGHLENVHPTTRRRVTRRSSVGGFTNNHEYTWQQEANFEQSKGRDRGTNRRRRGSIGKAPTKTRDSGALGNFFKDKGASDNNDVDDGTVYTTPVFSTTGSLRASSSSSSSVYTTPVAFSSTSSRRSRRRGSLGGSSALHGRVSDEDEYVDFRMALKDDCGDDSNKASTGKRLGGRRHSRDQQHHRSNGDRSRSGERSRRNRSGSPLSRKALVRSQSFEEASTKKANRYRLEDRQSKRRQGAASEPSSEKEGGVSSQPRDDSTRSSEYRHRDRAGDSGRRSKSPAQQQRRRTGRRNSMM